MLILFIFATPNAKRINKTNTFVLQVCCCTGLHSIRELAVGLIMANEARKVDNMMVDGLGRDLMNAGRFCFSCEQIFANRKCLEEHVCAASTFICSCGTEFTEYQDMAVHGTTHQPGHQALDHETIWKRRLEKRQAEEEQLKRIETGDVVWKAPKLENVASVATSLKPPPSLTQPQMSVHPIKVSQVPVLDPLSQAYCQSNPVSSNTQVKNVFGSVGAPTVDLWTLYQPVVMLNASNINTRIQFYSCGRCGQRFKTKPSLIAHHSTHVIDKISGCVGCGVLLSSKKLVPRFHVCNAPNNISKLKVITAKPQRPTLFQINKSLNQPKNAGHVQAIPTPESKSLSLFNKGSEAPRATLSQQLKTRNVKVKSPNNQRLQVRPLLPKTSNPRVSNAGTTVPLSPMVHSENVGATDKSSNTPLKPVSGLSNAPLISTAALSQNPSKTQTASKGFTCRVCYVPFETTTLLQRHKCTKAKEFMAQQSRPGKQQYRINSVTPAAGSSLAPMNGERMFGHNASASIKQNQAMAISLNQGHGALQAHCKAEADIEDDCYIVEPEKNAEMIYQVTSSVPIKT